MKILAVAALLCALMALTPAAPAAEEEPEEAPAEEELDVEKRASCNCGWTLIGQRSFLYVSDRMTWDDAEKNCISLGGHLASVHSQWEYDQIREVFSDPTNEKPDTWIGGSDRKQEGVWRWTDGSSFNFRKWCTGEPNNLRSNQNCLHMVYKGYKCWDDLWCNELRPSLCAHLINSTMKILAVAALLCALMALTPAAPAAEAEPEEAPAEVSNFLAAPEEELEEALEAVEKEEPEDEKAPAEELDVEKRTCRWTRIGRRSYVFIPRPLTWAQAERNCVALGGHLASVHSIWEYNKIRRLINARAKGSPATWLGGSDQRQEGVWRWTDGSSFNFRKWCCGEPNNGAGSNQDCLQVNYSAHKCWDDLWCHHRRPSVCARGW
ncbi:uncharacterized protein LOC141811233 [Halichoeres trimaculatus]|uniref:uncharacterized protein LOC141811233 n=1 Tax=Halichoeres trimaculatus TaxID=147232 RepID=UPI003D9F0B52